MASLLKLSPCLILVLVCCSCASSRLSTVEAIDALFAEYNQSNVPGAALLVVSDGSVLFKRSYGLAEISSKRPVTSSTNFRLASVTKQFTAQAILVLAHEQKLSLDDFLGKYVPGLPPATKEIRIRHLLNHTSGILDYESFISDSQTVQVLDRDVPLLLQTADSAYFPAGSRFQYSNSGYSLLALVVEAVSCMSFADFLQERVFAPLGMNYTVARRHGVPVMNRAYGYTRTDTGFVFTDQSVTSATLGDGGIYSSVNDLFKWDQSLFSEKLLPRATLDETFEASVKADSTESYGFGWYVGRYRGTRAVYHTGSTRGFRNAILRLPERSCTVIILTNRNEGKPLDVARKVADFCIFNGAGN